MPRPIRLLLLGAGNRGADVYGQYALQHPEDVCFVGVAEPDPNRRAKFAHTHRIPPEGQFTNWFEALQESKFADAVVIATQDDSHHNAAVNALDGGYDVLLEKPMATFLTESIHIVQTAEETGRLLMICHVLRTTEFFKKIKEIFKEGRLGQIINIALSENVSYFHMAHSYVRGHWRNLTESAPMIVAKCSHDFDLLVWFLDEQCTQLSSMGGLHHFVKENAPQGAPERCTDSCPAADRCPFYAPRIYLENFPIKEALSRATNPLIRTLGRVSIKYPTFIRALGKAIPPIRALTEYSGWPRNTITDQPESDQAVMAALQQGPYGRCVYRCDNNVVDHQIVNMTFESGITASLTMHGHSHEEARTLRVDGALATLLGKFSHSQSWLEIHHHRDGSIERITFPSEVDQTAGHGGGDAGLMRHFVEVMRGGSPPLTSARDSLESHLMAFAAEASRVADKTVDMRRFRKQVSE